MLTEDHIGRLFAVMSSAYGRQWSLGAQDVPVWLAKLKRYEYTDIKAAASRCIDHHEAFPPSLSQFLAAVRASLPPRNTIALPAPSFDQANANKAWDRMEALAGKPLRPTRQAKRTPD